MAATERAYKDTYDYQPTYNGATAYQSAYPQHKQEEHRRVRRTRERPQQNTASADTSNSAVQGLTIQELRQLVGVAVFVAVLLIGVLVLNAYAASVQCSINNLTKANMALEDEIDALNMKIDTSTSIEQIESYAMDELNMNYPKSNQCIYIEEDAVLMDNFASVIRQKAYE